MLEDIEQQEPKKKKVIDEKYTSVLPEGAELIKEEPVRPAYEWLDPLKTRKKEDYFEQ
jgi:hypothetical protein